LRPPSRKEALLSKFLSLIIIAAMVLHLIKPLGLPGLRRRQDFWKLAVAALAAISLTVLLRHAT
jgi:hypothetical protein